MTMEASGSTLIVTEIDEAYELAQLAGLTLCAEGYGVPSYQDDWRILMLRDLAELARARAKSMLAKLSTAEMGEVYRNLVRDE